ncbi:MAG: glycosyltransferase family 4 protein, partial [Delftia sp.]|nr:glycosyltransferase family 4 protein [Delftia sp.]
MRIAINGWFWDQLHTGSGQYTRQLLAHLLQIAPQHEYVLVRPEGSQRLTQSELANEPGASRKPGLRRKLGLRKVWFEQITFPRACRRLGADLAHVPYWGSPLSPTVPTLLTIHDIIPLLLPAYRGNALVQAYVALVQSAANQAALVLTDSQASRQDILAHLHLPEERVRTIYLAANPALSPRPAPDDDAVRARYGLPDEYVLYLAGFDARKNLLGLLQAWTFAEGVLGSSTPLVIAGHLPEHSNFSPDPRRIAQALEINPNTVKFPGPIEEEHKGAVCRGALCYLFTSRYEGFGLPPLEALACGAPVGGRDVSSTPETVGDAGVLLPPD